MRMSACMLASVMPRFDKAVLQTLEFTPGAETDTRPVRTYRACYRLHHFEGESTPVLNGSSVLVCTVVADIL